jgi:hypothetical protein
MEHLDDSEFCIHDFYQNSKLRKVDCMLVLHKLIYAPRLNIFELKLLEAAAKYRYEYKDTKPVVGNFVSKTKDTKPVVGNFVSKTKDTKPAVGNFVSKANP